MNTSAKQILSAAIASATDPGDEIIFDADAAIATGQVEQVWAMVDRLALLDVKRWGSLRSRLLVKFGRTLCVRQLDAALRDAQTRPATAPGGIPNSDADGDWSGRLLRNDAGNLRPCFDNVALYLENSTEWCGVLGYNEFTGGIHIRRSAPPPITAGVGAEVEDHFDTEATRWLERKSIMVKPDVVRRVIDATARRNAYHPVRQFLESLPQWDGTRRIGSWLIDYLGVQSSDGDPNTYAMAVGEKFLISAIARIMEPGCKADHMLVLEGPQGIGKSTVPQILAGEEFFSDKLDDMGSKDASMQLRGVWILEIGELSALKRAEIERAKGFFTQKAERFRLPYGKRVVSIPRQVVFIGTTNSETWLQDETGGRRFWPVRCGRIDLAGLKRDREQIWAEALARYREGATWWLDDDIVIAEATEQQRGRYQEDVWHVQVLEHADAEASLSTASYPNGRGSASISGILKLLGVETARQDQAAANRVARILKAGGWERFKARDGEERSWRYRKPAIATAKERSHS